MSFVPFSSWPTFLTALPFPTDVLVESLPVALHSPHWIQIQVGFGSAQTVSLHSSWVTHPCSHLLYSSFLFCGFVWSFSFIHAGLLPPLLDFMHGTDMGTDSKGGLQEQSGSPLLGSENFSHICTSRYMYLDSSLHSILDMLTNKMGEEGHPGLTEEQGNTVRQRNSFEQDQMV